MSKTQAAPLTTAEIKKTLGTQIETLEAEQAPPVVEQKAEAPATELAAIKRAGKDDKKAKQFVNAVRPESASAPKPQAKKEATMATTKTEKKSSAKSAAKKVEAKPKAKAPAAQAKPAAAKPAAVNGFKVGDKVRYTGQSADRKNKTAEIIALKGPDAFRLKYADGKIGTAIPSALEHVKPSTA